MKLLIFMLMLLGLLGTVNAANTWSGNLTIKSVSYDEDDAPKLRITVTVNENSNAYKYVTSDSNYPGSSSDGLKTMLSMLLTAQSNARQIQLLYHQFAGADYSFAGVR
jgi:hypothetical protein